MLVDCVTSPRAKRGVWAERMRLETATKNYDKNPINIGMTSLALSSAVTAGLPFSPTQLQLPSDACVPSRSEVECEMKQGEQKKFNSKKSSPTCDSFPFACAVLCCSFDDRQQKCSRSSMQKYPN